ncbi:MAG: hypothetical protein ACYS8W_05275 [Planctomycetota bacterium]|jgi:hypothetical protein
MTRFKLLVALAIIALFLAAPLTAKAGLTEIKKELKELIKNKDWGAVASKIRELGPFDSAAGVSAVIDAAKKCIEDVECANAIKATLLSMESQDAKNSICRRAKSAKPWQLKVIMAEAVSEIGGKNGIKALLDVAKDKDAAVVRSAALGLAKCGDKTIIEPVIEILKKWEKEHSATYKALNGALQAVTGKDLKEYHEWQSWWTANKEKFLGDDDDNSGRPAHTVEVAGGGMKTTLFGLEIDSRRIVFVIDVSGSMNTTEPDLGRKWREKYGGKVKTRAEEPDDDSEEGKKKKIERDKRITLAKLELQRCIKSLSSEVKFTIIAYSSELTVWKKSLQKASEGTKNAACKWVNDWKANSLTYTDDALSEAFKVKEADTIILVSDGSPTHIGCNDPTREPDDTPELIQAIYKLVEELNRFRKMTINTIGFETANKEFMAELAKRNNGKFRPIE